MTKKLDDSELEKIDGGMDQFQENPPDLDPKDRGIPPTGTGTGGGPGGGIADDMQQNPPDGGPDADA